MEPTPVTSSRTERSQRKPPCWKNAEPAATPAVAPIAAQAESCAHPLATTSSTFSKGRADLSESAAPQAKKPVMRKEEHAQGPVREGHARKPSAVDASPWAAWVSLLVGLRVNTTLVPGAWR